MEEVLIPLIFFSSAFGVIYLFFTTRNKERMAMIEKGQSAELFNQNRKWRLQTWTLKAGILFIGISLGIVLGGLLDNTGLLPEGIAYPAMIFMCGGIGLIISYFLERKLMEGKE